MNALPDSALALVDELIKMLDREIDLLDVRCLQLAGLSRASIERDDEAMETLLAEIETTQLRQESTDRELDSLRRSLAGLLGWPVARTRLGALLEVLPDGRRDALAARRDRIAALVDQLRRQHMSTALVVAESARINRMLLESLSPQSRRVTTYGVRGQTSWRPDAPLVDMET